MSFRNMRTGPLLTYSRYIGVCVIALTLLAGVAFRWDVFNLPIQGKDSWRQSKTGWNIRYFVRADPNILNPRQAFINDESNIQRYEFPLYQWVIAMVERVVGEHVYIERGFSYLLSLLALFAVFKIAMLITRNFLSAVLSVWAFSFLPTFFYNATSIMPDILGLTCALLYTFFFLRYLMKGAHTHDLILSASFIALAGLVKLPYLLLGVSAVVRFVVLITSERKTFKTRKKIQYLVIFGVALGLVMLWYGNVIQGWKGNNIATGFTQDFVGWPLLMQFLRIQITDTIPCELLNLPAVLFIAVGIYYLQFRGAFSVPGRRYFYISLLVLVLYFMYILNVIREGHDYYLMPFYPVLLVPMIIGVDQSMKWRKQGRLIPVLILLAMPLACWSRVKDHWSIERAYFNLDFFRCRDQLNQIGTWKDPAIVINDESLAILPYIIDKPSFVFWNDHLPVHWIKDMIKSRGAKYLYSDSRVVESQHGFDECISELILECGTLKIYRLRDASEIVF